jgi:hypothetical protein
LPATFVAGGASKFRASNTSLDLRGFIKLYV